METHVNDMLPGFALGTLDEKETEVVLEHLSDCAVCRAELSSFQVVTQSLGLAAPIVEPPPDLKQKLLGAITADLAAGADKRTRRKVSTSWGSLRAILLSWRPLVGLLVLALFASNLLLWRQVVQLRSVSDRTNFGLVRMVGTEANANFTGVIVVSPDGRDGTLVVAGFKKLDEGHQYQLWLIKDNQRTSGGLFNVSSEGYGALWVKSANPLVNYQQFGVTVEPRGGSPGPTGQKVLGGNF